MDRDRPELRGRRRLSPIALDASPLRDAAYVATRLGIPQKTVLQYARDGRLPSVKIGKHVRFVLSDIETAITHLRDAPS